MPKHDIEFRLFMKKILPHSEGLVPSPKEFGDPLTKAAQQVCMAIDDYARTSFDEPDQSARSSLHARVAAFMKVFIARNGASAARKVPECIRFLGKPFEASQALHNVAKALWVEARSFPRAPEPQDPKKDVPKSKSGPASSRRPKAQAGIV